MKNEGYSVSLDVGVAINYPQNFGDLLRVLAMVIHSMATISTNSCLGQNSKIMLVLRISFLNTQWTPDQHVYLFSSFTAQSVQNDFQNVEYQGWIQPHHIILGAKNDYNLIFCS